MTSLRIAKRLLLFLTFALLAATPPSASGQCAKWQSPMDSMKVMRHRELYKSSLESYDYEDALYFWQFVYEHANGIYEPVYQDGVTLHKKLIATSETEKERIHYTDQLLSIYDKRIECFPQKKGYLLARKGYEMHELGVDAQKTFLTLREAVNLQANATEPFAIAPLAEVTAMLWRLGKVQQAEKLQIKRELMAIVAYHTESQPETAAPYQAAGVYVRKFLDDEANALAAQPSPPSSASPSGGALPKDCDYYLALYKKKINDDPTNQLLIEEAFTTLQGMACSQATAFRSSLLAQRDNARALVFADNSVKTVDLAHEAQLAVNAGAYHEAIRLLNQATTQALDKAQKAEHQLKIAEIYYTKIDDKPQARWHALQSATFQPYWGEPYLLIGDLYLASMKNCYEKDIFAQRMVLQAAVDKWELAKKKDASIAPAADMRINQYKEYLPTKSEIYLEENAKEGKYYYIGCWIKEKVRARGR